eukprot:GHUV01028912.1.p1 GENE.GHUV01028912.1~~GHUV01028912.1.p1  ORF type:complete len:129 (-),score=7.90 GHUV01028912.1:574-960(-)
MHSLLLLARSHLLPVCNSLLRHSSMTLAQMTVPLAVCCRLSDTFREDHTRQIKCQPTSIYQEDMMQLSHVPSSSNAPTDHRSRTDLVWCLNGSALNADFSLGVALLLLKCPRANLAGQYLSSYVVLLG